MTMRTMMTNELICPYCGEKMEEPAVVNVGEYTNDYTLIECENCGEDFLFKVHVFYSSWKKEEK